MKLMQKHSVRSPLVRIGNIFLIQILAFFVIFSGDIYGSQTSNLTKKDASSGKIKRTAFADGVLYGQLRKKFQIEDVLLSKIKYPPPHSHWIESQKKFYQSILKGQTYDVLVVPFQTMENGVDPVGRMLMSYRLALSIEQNTKLTVAPLKLVYPALGHMARFYNEKEVLALAEMLGVSRIIWGYAGTRDYPDRENLQFSFTVIDQRGGVKLDESQLVHKSWPYQKIAPDILPSQTFDEKIGEVLDFLKIPDRAIVTGKAHVKNGKMVVPASPEELIDFKNTSPVYQSYIFQMLALLAGTDYHRNSLFTCSLINVSSLPKEDPDRRLVEARAYIYLDRRPAAIKALNGIGTKEGDALMEFVNANLPELEEKVTSLEPSIKEFLAQLDLFYLKRVYDKDITKEEKTAFLSKYPLWGYFLKIKLNQDGSWNRASNIELKQLMDKLFPISGFALKDIVVGYKLNEVASSNRMELDLLFQKHIKRSVAGLKDQLVGATHTNELGADHLLSMLDSVGIFNLLQKISFYYHVQGFPEEGLRLCEEALRVYEGHPHFTIYKAKVLTRLVDLRPDEEKQAIRSKIFDLALKAVWWNGRQNWVHSRAREYTWKPPKNVRPYIKPRDLMWAIDSDYPFNVSIVDYNRRPESMLLPYAHTAVGFHKNVHQRMLMLRKIDKANAILLDLKPRFNGNSEKTKLLATVKLVKPIPKGPMIPLSELNRPGAPVPPNPSMHSKPGGPFSGQVSRKERKALYLKEVEANSKDWEIYEKLVQMYIEEENYKAAQEIMLKYPEIKNPDQFHSVGVSNIAHKAGEILYWKGAIELSRPFYELSASFNTGSAAGLISKMRLAVMDRDFNLALEYAFRRARRYNSAGAYHDCITYLHLLGEHDAAWLLFTSLLGRFDSPAIWVAATTGHRIQGTEPQKLAAWMYNIARLSPAEKKKGYIARFGIWCLSDHAPSDDLVGAIKDLDAPPKVFIPNVSKFLKRKKGGEAQKGKPPIFLYSAFAWSYDLLKQKKYEAAFDAFYKEMDHFGWNYGNSGRTLKPYLAWAGVKSKYAETIKREMIRNLNMQHFPRGREFDVELAYAAYEGGIGNHEKAIKYLKSAFACKYLGEDRLFSTWYQLVELCEWLYDDSGDPRYRELALKWACSYQRLKPHQPWGYEVEAVLAHNREEKIKALAIALYLNPRSKRISGIKKQLKDEAALWMKKNNPFIIKPKGSDPQTL